MPVAPLEEGNPPRYLLVSICQSIAVHASNVFVKYVGLVIKSLAGREKRGFLCTTALSPSLPYTQEPVIKRVEPPDPLVQATLYAIVCLIVGYVYRIWGHSGLAALGLN